MSDLKALKLPDISSNVNEFEVEFIKSTKDYSKKIEIIDHISLLDTRDYLSREKLQPKLDRINSELLEFMKQQKLLNSICKNRKH